ncbi:MAG: hypothetical protein WCF04_03105 [Candidatus Nanopelagicales bacterium]
MLRGARSRGARSAFAALAVGLQLAVLYAPRAPSVDTGALPVDKAVHFIAFALPTASLIWAGVPVRVAVGAMALHAPASEAVQHYLFPNRSGEVADLVADLVGVAVGGLVGRLADLKESSVG